MIQLYNVDCRVAMAGMAENSVDSVVTDPPYGLKFMGKAWDHGVPGVEFWTAAMRVMKPGAHMLAFGGTRTFHRLVCAIEDAGFEVRDTLMWVYGSGFPKSMNIEGGYGTGLKPAFEPIVLVRKPLPKGFTVVKNLETWGVGTLNIDGCRVDTNGEVNTSIARRAGAINHLSTRPAAETEAEGKMASRQSPEAYRAERPGELLGRWPANLIHDGSDEVLDAFPDAPGQMATARTDGEDQCNNTYGALKHVTTNPEPRRDAGSAARFFYAAKASRKDRGEGNTHPTVKPTDLMRYLCRLVTPPGGVVLDPFMGSGSTGKAAVLEGFDFIGCDNDPESFATSQRRIGAAELDRLFS